MTRFRALALWLGAIVPCGILAHFAAEIGALHRNVVDVACAPAHAYLAVLAIASLALVAGIVGTRDLRRRGALLAAALPMRGRGYGFVALTAAVQLAFVAITIGIEGDPLAAGSLLSALAASLAVAVLGSCALCVMRDRLASSPALHVAFAREHRVSFAPAIPFAHGPYFAFVSVRGNRPPPAFFPIRIHHHIREGSSCSPLALSRSPHSPRPLSLSARPR